MQCRDHTPYRVVEQDRTHSDGLGELELVRGAEEWLVLSHRFVFVVEDGPPLPTQRGFTMDRLRPEALALPGSSSGSRVRSRRNTKTVLDFCLLIRQKIRFVGFACKRVHHRRPRLRLVLRPAEREQVVDKPRGGLLQNAMRIGEGVGEMREDRGLVAIGGESIQESPFCSLTFPMAAVPATMPNVSNATSARFRWDRLRIEAATHGSR